MPSLVTVNNNVSLISINVAPSTWLATVIVLFVLVALCIPRLSLRIPRPSLPRLPWLPSFPRISAAATTTTTTTTLGRPRGVTCSDKPLPPYPRGRQLVLRDHSLVVARRASASACASVKDGRSSRRPGRLLAGLRTPGQPDVNASLVSAAQRAGDGGSRGIRHRFGRWVLAAGMAEARQRRPEQRLLEASPASAVSRTTAVH